MGVEIRLEGDGEYTYYSPTLEVETSKGRLTLNYQNTLVRTFSSRWEDHRHIEYKDDPHANPRAIALSQQTIDCLIEQEFPMRFDPLPDSTTTNWFIKLSMMQLEQELADGSP